MTKVKANCCVRMSHTQTRLFTLSLGAEKTQSYKILLTSSPHALAGDFLIISNEAALAFVNE